MAMEIGLANEQDRDHVAPLVEKVQDETGEAVEVEYADQGYRGEKPAKAAEGEGVESVVVKRHPDQHTFIVLPKRWIVERSFGWIARCRRFLRDYERLTEVLVCMHMVAFVCLLLRQTSQLTWGTS